MSSLKDDELILLWRQGTSAEPDPAEVARLAGRASMKRFDRRIFWRNFAEYAAGVALLFFFGQGIVLDDGRTISLVGFVCVGFIMVYLWSQHRGLTPLDPSADARAYQGAMLARIDKQIRLLRSSRYWYLLPLYIIFVWWFLSIVKMVPVLAIVQLAVNTGFCAGAAWLNERRGVRKLRAERARIEGLYDEPEQ
jgi:hypothetical protein